jgi:glycosyltransferase involved in cell wall biosynthesis
MVYLSNVTRLVGLTAPLVVADKHGRRRGKFSGVFTALERRYEIPAILAPAGPRSRYIAAVASRLEWGENVADRFRRWTEESGRLLDAFEESYDLIFELGTLLAPGPDFARRPYVIYTDNTLALTLRHYPQWWPTDEVANAEAVELERQVSTSARLVMTLSEWARRSMIDDYGCRPERVIAVGGGSGAVPEARARWASRVALFVGNDFERKGGHVLLAAWPKVRERLPGAELWVVGPRRKRGSVAGVRWMGRVDATTLASLREQSAVFVLPSLFEPWGFVFNEAMSAGLACIGTTACAMPEIIRNEETGLLVEPGAEDELGAAVCRLLGDPTLAERMGRAALEDYVERGTWDHVADRIERAMTTMASEPEPASPTAQHS